MGRHSRPDDDATATPIQGQWALPRDRTSNNGGPSDAAASQPAESGDTTGRSDSTANGSGRGAAAPIPSPAARPAAPAAAPPATPSRLTSPSPSASPSPRPSTSPRTPSPPTASRPATPSSPPSPSSRPSATTASAQSSPRAPTSGAAPAAPFAQSAVRGKPPLSDHTQVIPRVPAATVAPSASTHSTALATPYPAISALYPNGTATVAPDPNPTTVFPRPRFDRPSTSAQVDPGDLIDDKDGVDDHDDPHSELDAVDAPRRHRLVWVGLTVFWLLGLGAGLVTLTSLGARASCTASDKSLDCGNAGSAIAVVLTLCVIVLVGVVSVHAIEVRDRAASWGRDVGLGVVVLLLLAFAAWRLILTING